LPRPAGRSWHSAGTSICSLGTRRHVTDPGDSVIGVVINGRGVVSMVASPMPDRSVVFARAAAGSPNTFHVLFVTGIDSLDHARQPTDTATIWYASYANGAWRALERVAETYGASLNPEFTSELLERGRLLSFVFPFVDDRDLETRGGLIALRRRNGRWSPTRCVPERAGLGSCCTRIECMAVLFSAGPRGAPSVFLTQLGAG
jgi:hypothetical protein